MGSGTGQGGRKDGRMKRARDEVSRLDLVSDMTRGCGVSHVIMVAHSDVVGRQQSKAGIEVERAQRTQCSLMTGKLSRKNGQVRRTLAGCIRPSLTIWASLPFISLLAWLTLSKT